MKRNIYILTSVFFAAATFSFAQVKQITIQECYQLARENYPLVKQRSLIEKSMDYAVDNLSKGYFPQLSVSAQASYQSEVIEFPSSLPGRPELTKDQYRIYAELNQAIYDGGVIKEQKEIEKAAAVVEVQRMEIEMYKVYERINQLYFGVLLISEQLKQNKLLINDLDNGIEKMGKHVENGVAIPSQRDEIVVEKLKAGQKEIELLSARNAYIKMLSLFTGILCDTSTHFITPGFTGDTQTVNRPELYLYDALNEVSSAQEKFVTARIRPRLSLFAQGGFGKPAFNILSNSFDPYYIGGLRLHIPISGYYTARKERSLLQFKRDQNSIQSETFLFNTNLSLQQQNEEVDRLKKLLETDDEIIALRERISRTAAVQLENGTLNSADYLHHVFAEDNARQNKTVHAIQLLSAQYTVKNTTGN